jgi:large subunit ribosomal protein L24
MEKIKKDDMVIVITGKDKGKKGKIINILKKKNAAIVDGINIVKKHVKPNPQQGQQGGIIPKEMPINLSNIALYNEAMDKADKVGFKTLEDGRKVRYFKSNNELVDIQTGG